MNKHIFEHTIEANKYEIQIGWDKPYTARWLEFTMSMLGEIDP